MLNLVTDRPAPRARPALRPVLHGLGLAALLLAASGCTPRPTAEPGRATAAPVVNTVSFYPSQTGLSYSYLPEGDPLNALPYTLTITGPTLFGDRPAIAYRFVGRGAEQTNYRQVSDGGVLLLGFSKPGLTVNLTPPWRESPPSGEWRAGLQWGGESNVQVFAEGKVVQQGSATYRYTVLEERTVNVAGESRRVWVVNRQINDSVGGLFPTASQEYWFAPFYGDLRTPEGLLQVNRNYRQ